MVSMAAGLSCEIGGLDLQIPANKLRSCVCTVFGQSFILNPFPNTLPINKFFLRYPLYKTLLVKLHQIEKQALRS